MEWHNKPINWQDSTDKLEFAVEGGTDFWRITHYGFIRDNGHFYYEVQEGEFEATVKVTGAYKELYDQAGLMIRIDEKNWIKTGIEFVDGLQNLSAVVTREYSDWSVVPLSVPPASIWLKLIRKGDFVEIRYALDGKNYAMLRLAHFPPSIPVQIGKMAAAPDGKGFSVTFEGYALQPLS